MDMTGIVAAAIAAAQITEIIFLFITTPPLSEALGLCV